MSTLAEKFPKLFLGIERVYTRACTIGWVHPAIVRRLQPHICEIHFKAEITNFFDGGLDKPHRLVLTFIHERYNLWHIVIECFCKRHDEHEG